MIDKIKSLGEIWELHPPRHPSIGGLIIGVFTATEAGAVGAFGAFVSALMRRETHLGKDERGLRRDYEDIGYDLSALSSAP